MALKKYKKGRKAISPLLEKILSDRSNVVFNVPKKVKQTERQFFDNARLNKAIIFKYPNFDMEISEFVSSSGMKKERPVETCMRSEEHTSELQSLMRISYAVFCLKKKINKQ